MGEGGPLVRALNLMVVVQRQGGLIAGTISQFLYVHVYIRLMLGFARSGGLWSVVVFAIQLWGCLGGVSLDLGMNK